MRWTRSPTLLLLSCITACFLSFSNVVHAVPSTFSLEAFITILNSENKRLPLSGIYDVKFELIKPNKEAVFTKTYTAVVTLGLLSVSIEKEDNLDPTLFKDHILSARLTISGSDIDTGTTLNLGAASFTNTEVILLPIDSIGRTVQSTTATSARSFLNENLIKIDEPSRNISIATTNIKSRLHVDGTMKATAFQGDASSLLNMDYIRWTRVRNPERIFYDAGFVGIGTIDPKAHLHVSGNLQVTQNQQTQGIGVNPLLTIRSALQARFQGDAPLVSSLNATNISHGTIHPDRMSGNYNQITEVGTISTGIWNSITDTIKNNAISEKLTLRSSSFENTTIKGSITITNNLTIGSNSGIHPLIINPNHWLFNEDASLTSFSTNELTMNSDLIEYTSTLNIKTTNGQIFRFSPLGRLGFPDTDVITAFNPSQSIRVGNTSDISPGIIRLNTFYEGHTSTGWKRLDKSGVFTGHSLFPENNVADPLIVVKPNGNIGLGIPNPLDSFVTSGNIVFLGNTDAPNISSITDGDYFLWSAKKGALIIGLGELSTQMFSRSNIGTSSVTIGHNAMASGLGSINISSPTYNSTTKVSGDYSVLIGSIGSELTHSNQVILSSSQMNGHSSSGVILSSNGLGGTLSGENAIVLNGDNPLSTYSNIIMGGKSLSSPLGNDSFMWDNMGQARNFGVNLHQSFVIGPRIKVGINTNAFTTDPQETLVVGGGVSANIFEGMGHLLTGDIKTEYLKVPINGVTQNIAPTINLAPQHIYVSDEANAYPKNTVSSASISNLSVEGVDFDSYSLDSHKIVNNSIASGNFQNGAIQNQHFKVNDLPGRVFSNIDGMNIEDNAINEEKITTDSIYTHHFIDEAVTQHHILPNMINSSNMAINNIALHAIQAIDIKPEELESKYFANESATGRNIGHKVLSTTMSGNTIQESYFVYEHPPGTPSPQIQEQHINTGEVKTKHIPSNSVYSHHIGYGGIESQDLTSNTTAGIQVADTRTVDDVVFTGRHFKDLSVTKDKFFDNCPAPTCATPTENFQLTSEQIGPDSIDWDNGVYDEITDNAVQLRHITPNAIVGRHIKDRSIHTIKFKNAAVISKNIAENTVSSFNIKNGSLVKEDFSLKSIEGVHIVSRSVTHRELANDSISSLNIGESIIDSDHITDKSLSKDDFAAGAFTPEKIKNGTIASDNIVAKAIKEVHFDDFFVSESKFKDHGVDWSNFIPPANGGGFPTDRFGDNTLDFNSKFTTAEIHGNKISTASITKDKVNIPAFSVDKLVVPLEVSKGGTGLTAFIKDAILYAYPDNGTVKMGQTNQFLWDKNNKRLTIGTPSNTPTGFNSGIITTGNILITNGALLLKKHSATNYTFVKYNSVDSAIQLTYNDLLSSNQSNMAVKTNMLIAKSSLVIGNSLAANSVDLDTGLRLGNTYRTNNTQPPLNGLIVQESLQINDVTKNIKEKAELNGYILRVDRDSTDGIVHATSANIGILSDITGGQSHLSNSPQEKLRDTPIFSEGRSVNAEAPIGIQTEAPSPIKITMDAEGGEVTGLYGVIVSNNITVPASAIQTDLQGSNITKMMDAIGYATPTYKTGIYGKSATTTKANSFKHYAGYFEGNFLAKKLTDKDTTPTEALNIDSIYVEGLNYMKAQTGIINSIDWREGSVANIEVDDNPRNIVFSHKPAESSKLIIVVEHSGKGILKFSDGDILWKEGYEPELTAIKNRVDIVLFNYDKTTDKYYGSAVYNFKTP